MAEQGNCTSGVCPGASTNGETVAIGSLPSLRSAHGIDYKKFRVEIDPRWIPRKMLNWLQVFLIATTC